LLAKNPILLAQVIDDLQLTLVHPPGDCDKHEPERIQDSQHLGGPLSRASCLPVANQHEFNHIQFSDHTRLIGESSDSRSKP